MPLTGRGPKNYGKGDIDGPLGVGTMGPVLWPPVGLLGIGSGEGMCRKLEYGPLGTTLVTLRLYRDLGQG